MLLVMHVASYCIIVPGFHVLYCITVIIINVIIIFVIIIFLFGFTFVCACVCGLNCIN